MVLVTGSRLGLYEILGPLGAGGMGEVFRARHTRLDREVAIKTLPERLANDPKALGRFEREARAVAALSHSNILAIHDFGADGDVCYAVMELLEGDTLQALLEGGPLPWSKAVEYGSAVADGLAAAHAKGIIHRDLKPANLFLTSTGQIKILDFGLARRDAKDGAGPETGEEGPDTGPNEAVTGSYEPALTEPGTVMGTMGYMSPEQLRGQAVDARTDIFALGCVMYELLAGKRAFTGGSRNDVVAATLQNDAPPFAACGREVPVELDRLVRRCLEKRPEDRFQSARDLAVDLRAFRDGSPVSRTKVVAAPPSTRSWTMARWASALLVVAGLVTGGFVYFRGDPQGKTPIDTAPQDPNAAIEAIAVLPFENQSRDPAMDFLSNGLSESIIINLSSLRNLKVRPFSSVAQYQGQTPDLRAIGRDFKVQAVLTGRVLQQADKLSVRVVLNDVRGDGATIWGGTYNDRKAVDLAAIEDEIAKQVADQLRVRLTPEDKQRVAKRHTPDPEAFQLYLKGRQYFNTSSTEAQTKEAIAHYQKAIAKDRNYPLVYVALAEAYYWLSNIYVAPTEVIPDAKEAARQALRLDDSLGDAHALLGLFYALYDWDWTAGEKAFGRAVALNPNSATVHLYYALFLTNLNRFDEASAELQRAQECDTTSFFIRVYPVYMHYLAKRYDEAIALADQLIEAHPEQFMTYPYRGLAYEGKREFSKAIASYHKALQLEKTNLECQAQLGHIYAMAGKRDEALAVLKTMMDIYQSRERYISPYNIAMIHLGLGDKKQALAWLDKASEDHSEWFGSLRVDPRLDPLRDQPHFKVLLGRARLAP